MPGGSGAVRKGKRGVSARLEGTAAGGGRGFGDRASCGRLGAGRRCLNLQLGRWPFIKISDRDLSSLGRLSNIPRQFWGGERAVNWGGGCWSRWRNPREVWVWEIPQKRPAGVTEKGAV